MRGDDLENDRSDDSPQTIDTEECEEIVINDEEDDDIEHASNEEAEIEYENHSDYSDIMRESETLDEMSPLFFLACRISSSDATSGGICDKRGVASWAAGLEGLSFLKH